MRYKEYTGFTKTYVVCRNEGFGVMEDPYEEKEVVFETDNEDEAYAEASRLKILNNTPEQIQSSWVPNTYWVNINTLSEGGARLLLQFKAEGELRASELNDLVDRGEFKKIQRGDMTFYFKNGDSVFDKEQPEVKGREMADITWKGIMFPVKSTSSNMSTQSIKTPKKEFWDLFKSTPGAISCCEALAIMNLAASAPGYDLHVDIGSHAGKSAMAAAQGHWMNTAFWLVDPIYDLNNRESFKHSIQGSSENIPWHYVADPDFNDKVMARVGGENKSRIALAGMHSTKFLNTKEGARAYGYVFIDSDDHQEELVMEEVKLLEDKMVHRGIIAFHDFENQYHGPKKAYDYLISTGKYASVDINWDEIRAYVKENNLEEGNDSWHACDNPLPCFVGAVTRI